MRLITGAEMRALERHAMAAGVSEGELMERAGTGVAHAIAGWLDKTAGRRLLTLAGKGNNGGDAIIATRVLAEAYGVRPSIFLTADRGDDPLLAWARSAGVPMAILEDVPEGESGSPLQRWLDEAEIVLDGLLGIGARLPLEGAVAQVLAACREVTPAGQRRIAVDVPSGVHADTGAADRLAFRADLTVATGPPKVGLFIHPGAEHAGRVREVDLLLTAEGTPPATLWRLDAEAVARLLPPRPDDSNKGTFGKVLVVAGSGRYTGAAALSAAAAVRSGAGLVTLAAIGAVRRAVAPAGLETTFLPLEEDEAASDALTPRHVDPIATAAQSYSALAIGPGIGDHPLTRRFVLDLVARLAASGESPPVVLDADGLNALAEAPSWAGPSSPRWVLTPHPGEMGRLLRRTVREVQEDRLRTARESAGAWGQVVVLKGAPSVVAAPDGRTYVSPFANAALATAGTGDVLTGTVAGLLAQKLEPFEAAGAGAFLHGLAAERWRAGHGDGGLAASELLEELPGAARYVRRHR